MNIHIDTFLYDSNYKPTAEEHIYYTEMLKFVAQRLKPLEDEIGKEETENNDDSVTFVHVIDSPTKGYIRHYKYSKELTAKIIACFSLDDIKYMEQRITGVTDGDVS